MTNSGKIVVSIVGARPQFIKVAPVSQAFEPFRDLRHVLIHTGQHYDWEMSALFFRQLQLPEPDVNLGVGSGTHGYQTGEIMKRLDPLLQDLRPDYVLVYGDTNSTLAGALSAVKLGFPVGHVEAGERSGNRRMPEEINRILTDRIADLLFCVSGRAVRHLESEGLTHGVHQVGDVMRDMVAIYLPRVRRGEGAPETPLPPPGSFALVTIHRAENTDDPGRLRDIVHALQRCRDLGLEVIWPLHPRTAQALKRYGIRPDGIGVRPPVSYLEMLHLEIRARVILTDSGGVQKEAYWLGVPCVTVRDETEWAETVESGWNRVAGTDPDRILAAVRNAAPGTGNRDAYGTGDAAGRIAALVRRRLGLE